MAFGTVIVVIVIGVALFIGVVLARRRQMREARNRGAGGVGTITDLGSVRIIQHSADGTYTLLQDLGRVKLMHGRATET